ncbi:MAG: serine/threonine-protein kinase, partial [Chloroflexota bacterium]
RFIREGRALEQLDHPHIVSIIDIHDEGDDYYIIMEYVDGLTLSAQIRKHGQLPIKPAVQVSYALASALDYIHLQGIIHRDIKPSNIMFTSKGSPRLMDFGVAHLNDATPMTAPGAVLGTLSYVSPEIIYGGKATVKSDVWALGMTIYKMLTGELPFGGSTPAVAIAEILSQPVPPVIVARQDTPLLLAGLVDMMLQKDPQLRIDSMARVKEQLKSLMG